MSFARTCWLVCLLCLGTLPGWADANNIGGLTPQMAQDIAATLRGDYGTPPALDGTVLNLQTTDYKSLDDYVGNGTLAEYGQSQRLVVRSLFAFGASMDNASFQSVRDLLCTGVPMEQTSVMDTAKGQATVGILSAWVIVPTLVNVFATMDIYIQQFFGGMVLFSLFMVLVVTMGVAMLQQLHEGKLDVVSWSLRSVTAATLMVKANLICNLVLAAAIGLAALINGSVIHNIIHQDGINSWYLKLYGPQVLQAIYAFIAANKKADISRAFTTDFDNYNIQRYAFNENGADTTKLLCQYLGGAEAYNINASGGASVDQTYGCPLKELEGMWCLMIVYNVGMNNLNAHESMGDTGIPTARVNFEVACAQVFYGNPSITAAASDSKWIDGMRKALKLTGSGTPYQYLKDRAQNDPAALAVSQYYVEPPGPSGNRLYRVATAVRAHSANTSIWSWVRAAFARTIAAGKSLVNWMNGVVAGFVNMITSGLLQVLLMAGLFFWIIIGMALCKLGCVMLAITAPFLVLPNTSKLFWTSMKSMVYPAIYPAALIIIMQMTAALSSWIGTIGATISGVALIFNVLPLLFGIVTIFMLPMIVKSMLTGGNVFLAQLSGVKTAVMLAAAAATGGAVAASLSQQAQAAKAGSGGGAGAATAGASAGGTSPPSSGPGGGSPAPIPSTPVAKAVAGAGKPVGSTGSVFSRGASAVTGAVGAAKSMAGAVLGAKMPGSKGTVGKSIIAGALAGVPGVVLYNMHSQRARKLQAGPPPAPSPISPEQRLPENPKPVNI